MKQAILLLLILGLPSVLLAQSPEELFAKGNEAYQQGNLPQAIELYTSIVRNGYTNGDLYYNLGNAYYRSGNTAQAILNYERALRLMPEDDDLRHNLQIASLMVVDKIEATPKLFLWEWSDAARNSFSLDTATWLAYGCFVALITALAVVLIGRTGTLRLAGLWTAGVGFFLLILFLLVFLSRVSDIRRTDEAVVTTALATIKNSPDDKSSDAFVLHAGVKVQMTDRVETWIKIRIADGKVGWMEAGGLEMI